ncbi:glycerol-3-phosphate 1-O-acyltransferase PlsY [Thermomonas sp.]|uniref:glycerol-3-phosphate 1-O-acyltransferase PlsY n=1 Tax=Thermomonas sp. TaxID=1971895 RepID=UPI001D95BEE6|nr:glycerol-3-phosphate 1-O-acyltransferase PlsY [Thermomonas sp.]MBZ0086625.1 glycerol-3-phosphate 1-O-acyltransferase PlsY [Thermomonas sp.]HRO64088.1 glycerol-3-phosphate 1-O-acyltransferase PlsY [Thermomonas sp.]
MPATLPPALVAALVLLAAYLLGSLSGSLLLGRLRGVDVRTQGSGNAGGTNAFRTQGARFALGVVAIDLGKGALAAWLALQLAPAWAWWSLLAVMAGHVWPVWHGFRGGKGAAAGVGALLVLWPLAVALLVGLWLLVLIASGYVGLATVLAAASLPLWAWLLDAGAPASGFAVAIALFIAFTHRENLRRLWRGNELRFERARLLHRWRGRA